jgi:branched-subunit amino acid ABC-type transport system permease component
MIYSILAIWILLTIVNNPGGFTKQFISGVSYSMVLILVSIGLTLILGLMGVVNFAHGVFFTIGGYVAYTLISQIGVPFFAALLIVPIAVGLFGTLTELTLIRRIYDQDPEVGLLLTFGLAVILRKVIVAIYGPQFRTLPVPSVISQPFSIGVATIPGIQLFTIFLTAIIVAGLVFALQRTMFGVSIRAGVQDASMAEMTGINLSVRFTVLFSVGVALAALPGMLQAAAVGFNPLSGDSYIILAFVIVVVGGMGSIAGNILASFLIGVSTFIVPIMLELTLNLERLGISGIGQVVPFVIMVIVLLTQPRGLMGEEGFLE